ncbi:hypothetical protein P152DRAFT_399409 [Eremomyces bilateralis CBS 781.70]|uniref:PH domain-containing protein n=1 Tax=Eremomyces bilateralis CBS 781.70 TaxID=1392243 RepID=A0A6G1G0I0_9PEZI|nr:uncharacterized protein P152DRAFT_399409 [Eremomyces bilateralis CBS 781.70]KAF1811319.1 hypothetical protein P152DRAFT_399409 [Eremomyces bilateralis CBS 781.70]
MASQPGPSTGDPYHSVPIPTNPSFLDKGYGLPTTSGYPPPPSDYTTTLGNPTEASPLSRSMHQTSRFNEGFDTPSRTNSVMSHSMSPDLYRSSSRASNASQGALPSRGNTIKKQASVRRKSSLKRKGSRRSIHAGSIKGYSPTDDAPGESTGLTNSAFHTPVPTSGSPTDILANRFQAWRKFLKDLITYFRELQNSYDQRAKALLKVSSVINNVNAPSVFLTDGGINDANRILRDYHKQALVESNKARDMENEVIAQLSGLRADLSQKIKEIKSLAGDFKNSVDKEKDQTRKVVTVLEEALAAVDTDPSSVVGKDDPFVIRLRVDRQVERQIDEENYLHRAYLNLEGSGRELESIVVGEIQKAYNALASILKRDADESYSTVDLLRSGPIAMPKEYEWTTFIGRDPHFISPDLPLRRIEEIEYPGKHHPAATEVRAGMLERKSKYLKSYTPGWYVLSPTHIHEFKSADRIYSQPPVMSLYLPDQKVGSHSQPESSSHKFILKGRQTGAMHRGHTWVFRAESHETMLAWYEDIKALTERSGESRNAYVRRHARSISAGSARSISGDSALEEDEADEVPYSANSSTLSNPRVAEHDPKTERGPPRPQPGGRFPSDVKITPHLHAPLSASSGSSEIDHDLSAMAGGLHEASLAHPPSPSNPALQHGHAASPTPSGYDAYHPPVNHQQSPSPGGMPRMTLTDTSYLPRNPRADPPSAGYASEQSTNAANPDSLPHHPSNPGSEQNGYLTGGASAFGTASARSMNAGHEPPPRINPVYANSTEPLISPSTLPTTPSNDSISMMKGVDGTDPEKNYFRTYRTHRESSGSSFDLPGGYPRGG